MTKSSRCQDSFYFYDLETSGFNPAEARVMQFAGQRTTLSLEPIGPPDSCCIRLTPDILPDPGAIMVTGITPQMTYSGLTEAEFLIWWHRQVCRPNTIFVGYNSLRFDDEFMRYLHFRNFYDPYKWHWQHNRSRWDILDLTRMVRALRPRGVNWPHDNAGRPSNRLQLLAAANELAGGPAHSALGDVQTTLNWARQLRSRQPRLFNWLLRLRTRQAVTALINSQQPLVYTSGRYSSDWLHTTVVMILMMHPRQSHQAIVYDLRCDPRSFADVEPLRLAALWRQRASDAPPFPLKTVKLNRCPAMAPLSVLDGDCQSRLKLDLGAVETNQKRLQADLVGWRARVAETLKLLEGTAAEHTYGADGSPYDGFYDPHDQRQLPAIRRTAPQDLLTWQSRLHDQRLKGLLLPYKARNFANKLTASEKEMWRHQCRQRINSQLPKFDMVLDGLAGTAYAATPKKIISSLRQYRGEVIKFAGLESGPRHLPERSNLIPLAEL